jgi:hypothetical protein
MVVRRMMLTTIVKVVKEFVYLNLIVGPLFGLVATIRHPERAGSAFILGIEAGFCYAVIMSLYVLTRVLFFRKRWFHFANIENDLQSLKVDNIQCESLAVDTSSSRVVVGGLFLGKESLIFIPHRFAFRRNPLAIPLANIESAEIEGINLLKFFSGGLRKRLVIWTKDDLQYQFGVLDTEGWQSKINSALKDTYSGRH